MSETNIIERSIKVGTSLFPTSLNIVAFRDIRHVYGFLAKNNINVKLKKNIYYT